MDVYFLGCMNRTSEHIGLDHYWLSNRTFYNDLDSLYLFCPGIEHLNMVNETEELNF